MNIFFLSLNFHFFSVLKTKKRKRKGRRGGEKDALIFFGELKKSAFTLHNEGIRVGLVGVVFQKREGERKREHLGEGRKGAAPHQKAKEKESREKLVTVDCT